MTLHRRRRKGRIGKNRNCLSRNFFKFKIFFSLRYFLKVQVPSVFKPSVVECCINHATADALISDSLNDFTLMIQAKSLVMQLLVDNYLAKEHLINSISSKRDQLTVSQLTVDQLTVDQLTVDQWIVNQLTVNQLTVDQLTVDQMTINQLTVDQMTINQLTVGQLTVDQLIVDQIDC